MALVIAQDGKKVHVSAAQGERLWRLKTGLEAAQDAREQAVVDKVKKVYLSRQNAPTLYIEQNIEALVHSLLADWIVDHRGNPVKPEERAWDVARRTGMWQHGRVGNIVLNHRKELPLPL